jgi:ribosomal protein S18 acetylase RimI-like enzyme
MGGRLVSSLGLIRTDSTTARYQSVETHPAYRRQGLAGRLIYQSSLHGPDKPGAGRLVIVADPEYHAIDLYRRLGFTVAEQQVQLVRAA